MEVIADEIATVAPDEGIDPLALLATLPVEPETEDGYERELFEHQFVADWVAIKATWGLSVDETERDAIEATLASC